MTRRREPRLLLVPTQVSLAFTADRGWHAIPSPAPWFLDEAEEQLARDELPVQPLHLVVTLRREVTACRPGSGQCRRRHQHASQRRAAASYGAA